MMMDREAMLFNLVLGDKGMLLLSVSELCYRLSKVTKDR